MEDSAYKNIAHILLPQERHIRTTFQHLIVLFKGYFFTILAFVVILVAASVLLQGALNSSVSSTLSIVLMAAIFIVPIFAIILYVITYAYNQTVLVITNCSVVQVQQKGLLYHKVARLSMADVEDVSSEQLGIWTRVLGYGTLTIQTAGEMQKFVFKYCPDPIYITEIILNARDQYNESIEQGRPQNP